MRIAPAMQQLLPLAHHAHIFVVEDEDLDRQVVLHGGRHFLHRHLHAGLAGDVDDQRIGMGHLHAHRRRQAIAHGAEAAGGHPAIGLLELEALRRPHLVLADFGGDVDVAALGQLIEPVDGILRLDERVGIPEATATSCARHCSICFHHPSAPPRRTLRFWVFQKCTISRSALAASATMGRSTRTFLLICEASISRWIFFEPGEKASMLAGDAVVEARAQADHQVAIMHGVIGFVGAVHADAGPAIAAREAGKAPSPIRVEVMGKPVSSTSSRSSLRRFRARN